MAGSPPVSESLKKILAQKCSSDLKLKQGPTQAGLKIPIHGNAKALASGATPKKALLTVSPARSITDLKIQAALKSQSKGSPAKPVAKVFPAKPSQDTSSKPTDPRLMKKAAASTPNSSAVSSGPKVKTPAQGSTSSAKVEAKKGVALDSTPKATKKATTQEAQQQNYELRKTPTTTLAKGNMRCVQCGRERSIALARSSKFCTQRCTVQWVEATPPKAPEAVDMQDSGDSKAASASESPKAPLPRALKNLQIDMAKPGTKLYRSSSSPLSDSDSLNSPTKPQLEQLPSDGTNNTISAVRSNIIENLATLIAQQQQTIIASSVAAIDNAPPAPGIATTAAIGTDGSPQQKTATPGAPPKAPVLPKASGSGDVKIHAKGAVKRSTAATHTSAAKKPKVTVMKSATQTSQKSVSFNLNETPEISGAAASSSSTNPVLDRIASYLLPKKTEVAKIKLPPGEFCTWGWGGGEGGGFRQHLGVSESLSAKIKLPPGEFNKHLGVSESLSAKIKLHLASSTNT